jgi:hypothetical protein
MIAQTIVAGSDQLTVVGCVFTGSTDCSGNPNYPAATAGDVIRVSVAGKIGGASGDAVLAGDYVICITTSIGGTKAAVGAEFTIARQNKLTSLQGQTSIEAKVSVIINGTQVVGTQKVGATQAAVTQTQTALTDSTGGTASTTLAEIAAGVSYDQADMTAAKNAIASLAAELALIKTDMANTQTLINKLRTDLVAHGLIKGAA